MLKTLLLHEGHETLQESKFCIAVDVDRVYGTSPPRSKISVSESIYGSDTVFRRWSGFKPRMEDTS